MRNAKEVCGMWRAPGRAVSQPRSGKIPDLSPGLHKLQAASENAMKGQQSLGCPCRNVSTDKP